MGLFFVAVVVVLLVCWVLIALCLFFSLCAVKINKHIVFFIKKRIPASTDFLFSLMGVTPVRLVCT